MGKFETYIRRRVPLTQALGLMEISIRYASSRSEIWRWYWRNWVGGRWLRYTLLMTIPIMVVGATNLSQINGVWLVAMFALLVAGVMAITLLTLLASQVLFKKSERTLTIEPTGWSTVIGAQSGSCPWTNVQSVEEKDDLIAINGKNGNAIVVPSRAFSTTHARQAFLAAARGWHRAAST